jgi:hypothetical protein
MAGWWPKLSWFSSDSTGLIQQQVAARNTLLAENTDAVAKVEQASQELEACYKAQRAAYPAFFNILSQPNLEVRSEKEMAQELGKMIRALVAIDLSSLGEDLNKISQTSELFERLVNIWEKIETDYDKALADLDHVLKLDEKNIQDLTTILGELKKRGVQPCHNGPKAQ